jgi:NADH-quinone oxidoreductase subunit M
VLFLVAILFLYFTTGTTDIPAMTAKLLENPLPLGVQQILWLAMFVSFAVKVPMWPFHTWLPDAHVEAPTAGSVLLAGVLLKLGGYGFLRFSCRCCPTPRPGSRRSSSPSRPWRSSTPRSWRSCRAT